MGLFYSKWQGLRCFICKRDRAQYSTFLNGTDKIKKINFSDPSNINRRNSEFKNLAYGENAEANEPDFIPQTGGNPLIESYDNYHKYKANMNVYYDIDKDGTDEEIYYDSVNGKLNITGYNSINIDAMSIEKENFIIINFNDKFGSDMNMIGILDYGPSADYTTNLYSIIAPRGEKSFVGVGSVPGEIVPPNNYDEQNIDDFNYKAVIYDNKGIEAPVRLSITPQTWFGRNLFTYYSTYCSLLDNNEKFNQNYQTQSELSIKSSIKAYQEKDLNSKQLTIKGGQKVYLIGTDNKEWIFMVPKMKMTQ